MYIDSKDPEFIGRIMDVVEDHMEDAFEAEYGNRPDEPFLVGETYDKLASDFESLMSGWLGNEPSISFTLEECRSLRAVLSTLLKHSDRELNGPPFGLGSVTIKEMKALYDKIV